MGRTNKKKAKQKDRRNKAGPSGTDHNHHERPPQVQRPPVSGGNEHRSIYARYKEATRSFRDGLSQLLPPSIPLTSVSHLGNAVEYLLGKASSFRSDAKASSPPIVGIGLLSCLKESIKLREDFTSYAGGDADAGHAYMNGMLRYCHDVLRKCRRILVASTSTLQEDRSKSIAKTGSNSVTDRFGALNVDEEGGEAESDEEDEGDHAPITRPCDPDREYSIEKDLIEGDDRIHAVSFMFQMNMLMGMVDYHLLTLKSKVDLLKTQLEPDLEESVMTLSVVSCSACVNLALEEIKYIEEALVAECPQFKTFYHVVALLVFPPFVKMMEGMVHPSVLAANPHIGLDFIAKEVEFGFRTPCHPDFHKFDQRSNEFVRRAKLSRENARAPQNIAMGIACLTLKEVCPDYVMENSITTSRAFCDNVCRQLPMHENMHKVWEVLGVGSSGQEGDDSVGIGRDVRGILHTQSLLQCQTWGLPQFLSRNAGTGVVDQTKLQLCRPPWDENCNKAESIDDPRMEDFFLRCIYMPFLNKIRSHGSKRQAVFDGYFQEKGLLGRCFPLMQGFLNLLNAGDSRVPYSFTLSVYAALKGVLLLQGDLVKVGSVMRKVSNDYYDQIQWLLEQGDGVESVLTRIKTRELACLPGPLNEGYPEPEDCMLLAFWNPLAAGSLLSHTIYLNNVWYPQLLNTNDQLVSSMHLFNALKARNLLSDGSHLLSAVDSIFKSSKVVWGEGKPEGDFCKSYFVACEMPLCASTTMADFIKATPWNAIKRGIRGMEAASEERKAAYEAFKRQNFVGDSDMEIIRMQILLGMIGTLTRGSRHQSRSLSPKDVCTSFDYLIRRDFSGLDKDASQGNSVSALSSAGCATTMSNFYHRQRALHDTIWLDVEKLHLIYPKVAWILQDSLRKLATHMGWDELIDKCCKGFMAPWKMTAEAKKKFALNVLIGDRILGELDAEQDDTCTDSKRCAAFLETYFEGREVFRFF